MNADPLLPIAPARVKALVLPVGRIRRSRFLCFLERLAAEHVVHLRDISPDNRPNRNMFSPLAFPDGAIFYEFATHFPHAAHLGLYPFDLYREPMAIIAIADGSEMDSPVLSERQSGGGRTTAERNIRSLYQELEELRDQYPKVLVHQLVVFDHVEHQDEPIPIPEGIVTVPPIQDCKRTTMRTVMCDISAVLLAEMTMLAKSFEAVPYVESPGQTSTMRQNGMSWNGGDTMRRNSQISAPTARSSSASASNRMSMPVLSKSSGGGFGSNSSTPARPSTPVGSALPTTAESEFGSDPPTPEQNARTSRSGGGASDNSRSVSQDRVSVQGFGWGGFNERWRSKGKGRITIVTGSLYLMAGRWPDALKELIEGATVARSINDHIWQGKALEMIVVCLIMLGWAGVQFQVPTICLPPPGEKPSAHAATAAAMAAIEAEKNADPNQPKCWRSLQSILPELVERIVGLYSRISSEHLPPLPLAEAIIRLCKTTAALHICDGRLTVKTIELLVTGKAPDKALTSSPRLTVTPPRTQIMTLLFKAFPSSQAELISTVDRVVILTGIASVLGVLGYQRKKALAMRELVSVLVGGLVEARTRGAAEVGIHPAAGLAALNGANGQTNGAAALELEEGDIEQGMDAFLGLLLRTYGVVGFDMAAMISPGTEPSRDDSDAAVVARIQKQASARFYGISSMKLNILRACINFSEALPDFSGVLRYSSDLLRTAGSGLAPGPRKEDAAPIISREEQVRLMTNILKTSSLAERLGMGEIAAEFWDEFLLRGVKLEPLAPARAPTEHKKSELVGASTARSSQDLDPLIHNPFMKVPDKAGADQGLVAGESVMFKLTLQNPYDLEIELERVQLDADGAAFESSVVSAFLGPYRTQILRLSGTPKAPGPLHITGAIIKVRGCRERRFPIFLEAWQPEDELKPKAIGLAALEHHVRQPNPASTAPKIERLSLNVIEEQPIVVVKSTSLPQSSVMILEGERQVFTATLHNLSKTTAADFLLFSFQDSTQEPLQQALNRRDATPAELYEYELILAKKQALRLRKAGGQAGGGSSARRYIGPGEEATFEFEILGKPGLTSGVIQVDYAHLGVPPEELPQKFYTRQATLQLTITVNASVELTRVDILPLHDGIPRRLLGCYGKKEHDGEGSDEVDKDAVAKPPLPADEEHCLLLLDLRNSWPNNMHIELTTADGVKLDDTILPGNTWRVVVPFKRLYVDNPHEAVPALNPARQRQFVVSTTISPEAERASREAFWYRDRILKRLGAKWRTGSASSYGGGSINTVNGRTGDVELRNLRLTPRMIEAVKVDEVGIELWVTQQGRDCSNGDADTDGSQSGGGGGGNRKNDVFVDELAQLRARVTNRTAKPIYPTIRLMPALCHRSLNVALDFTRKLAWNGTLQRTLPLLPGGESAEVAIGVTALCRGEFEITASVEETKLWRPAASEKEEGDEAKKKKKKAEEEDGGGMPVGPGAGPRPRSDTQTLMDAVLGATERRIWHTRRPCYVVVRERE
ncbi:hypothetical protein RB600_009348 [Gaeumannomyces tritici]